jgi:hypothetical protein
VRVIGNEGETDERHCTELDFTPSSLQPLRKYGALTSFVPRDFANCKWLPLVHYARWKKRLDWHDCRNVCTLEICCCLIFERYLIIYHNYHKKIRSTPSFRGEVKPSVPCSRFATCERSLELRGSRILDEICRNISRPRSVPPSAARGLSRRWT